MEITQRYKRQLGLVYQETIQNLDILITGNNTILPYLLTNLSFLGVGSSKGGLHLYDDGSKLTSQDLIGQLFFHKDDIDLPLWQAAKNSISRINDDIYVYNNTDPNSIYFDIVVALPFLDGSSPQIPENQKVIWGQISNFSIFIGNKKVKTPRLERNILTPSLSSLCAGLISQEILRITDCIRPSDITKTWITVNYLFKRNNALETYEREPAIFRKIITSEDLKAHLEEPKENSGKKDSAVYRVELPIESRLHEFIIDSIKVLEKSPAEIRYPTSSLFFSPIDDCLLENGEIIEPTIDIPNKILPQKILLLGVGGLGSWLASLLAVAEPKDLELIIVDEDLMVEQHNLNRQILFTPNDVGLPKAIAAANRLKAINSSLNIQAYVGSISFETIRCYREHDMLSPQEFDKIWGSDIIRDNDPFVKMNRKMDLDKTLATQVDRADIVVSCLDSLFIKYVASVLAYCRKTTLVNAGSQHFEGNVDLIPHEKGCLLCWHGDSIKYRKERFSCGEQASDTPSIVTTTSIIASIQTAILLSYLFKIGKPKHYVHYRGKGNVLSPCNLSETNCPLHRKKPGCPDHLNWSDKNLEENNSLYKFF